MDPRVNNSPTTPSPTQNEQTTQQRPEENKGWFSWATNITTHAAKTLTKVVYSKTEEKQNIINAANQTTIKILGEEEGLLMVQLSSLMGNIAAKEVGRITGTIGRFLEVDAITRAFVAQAFANLAEKMQAESSHILKYGEQPALTSVIVLLAGQVGSKLSQAKLTEIEEKHHYQENMKGLRALNQKCFFYKDEDNQQVDSVDYANELTVKYLQSPDSREGRASLSKLLDSYLPEEKAEFWKYAEPLNACGKEVQETFNDAVKAVVKYIFPLGLKDPALSKFIESEMLFDSIIGAIEKYIGNELFAEYQSVRAYSTETESRKQILENAVHANVDTVVEAPAKLIGGIVNHVLQFNPAVLEVLSSHLQEAAYSRVENPTEDESKKAISQELTFKHLGNWILESFQAVAKTEDKKLEGILNYGTETLKMLTENILGKAASLLPSKDEKQATNQLFADLADLVKTTSNSGKITDKITDFVEDMPIPSTIKKMTSKAILESANLEDGLSSVATLHTASREKLEAYKGGPLLLAIIKNISKLLVEKINSQENEWFSDAKSKTFIQNLLDEFLPGFEIDPTLKESFKENFEAFKESQFSNESFKLLSEGIETVIMQAILGAITKDFNPEISVKDQFLERFNEVFSNKFFNLTPEQQKESRTALKIQSKIDALIKQEKELKDVFAKKEQCTLNPVLKKPFQNVLTAQNRLRNAVSEIHSLENKFKEKLNIFNKTKINNWDIGTIKNLHDELGKIGTKPSDLPILSNLSSDALKKTSSLLDIYATLQRAKKEHKSRQSELTKSFEDFKSFSQDANYNEANDWLETHFDLLIKLDELSHNIKDKELEQKEFLPFFQELIKEVATILGLGNKDNINLPTFLLDKIWPMIEDVKSNQGAKILFDLTAPVWLAVADKEINKKKLLQNEQNTVIVKLVETATKRILKEIPNLLSNPETAKSFLVSIDSYLPGILQMEGNLIEEINSLITGPESFFYKNEVFLQNYIEGLIFKYMGNITEKDIVSTIITSLNSIVVKSEESNEVSSSLVYQQKIDNTIDTILSANLKIESENDLESIPIPLRPIVYAKLKEGIKDILLPLIMPSVKNDDVREVLTQASGSPFLSDLSAAISDDLLTQLPLLIQNLDKPARDLYVFLSKNQKPNDEDIQSFTKAVTHLRENDKITNQKLAEAYAHIAFKAPSQDDIIKLKSILQKEPKFKASFTSILMTINEIATLINKTLEAPDDIKKLLENELNAFIKTGEISYVAKSVVEHQLLAFFTAFTGLNPPEGNKDSFFVFVDKFISTAAERFSRDKSIDESARNLETLLLEPQNLGIYEGLKTLPSHIRKPILKAITGKLENAVFALEKTLPLNEVLKENEQEPLRTLTNQVAQYIGDLTVARLPALLTKTAEDGQLILENIIPSKIENQLETLASANSKLMRLLLNHLEKFNIKEKSKTALETAALVKDEDKAKAAALITNIIAEPLNAVVNRAITLEDKYKEKLNAKIATNLLNVFATHLEVITNVQKEGSLTHESFVKAAGTNLHPAVPIKDLDFEKSIDALKTKLNDLKDEVQFNEDKIRAAFFELALSAKIKGIAITHERIVNKLLPILDGSKKFEATIKTRLKSFSPQEKSLKMIILDEIAERDLQRKKEFYNPLSRELLYVLFPNGKEDLKFVPKSLQKEIWKLLKTSLLPAALPLITETILEPQFINQTVLSILKSVEKKLADGPKKSNNSPPIARDLTELDEAGIHLTEQLLLRLDLPSQVKNIIFDENNKVKPEMKQVIGDAFRQVFNENFIKDTLTSSLKGILENKGGVNEPAKPKVAVTLTDIQKAARGVINSSISFGVDSWWNNIQEKWDNVIKKQFGEIGGVIKKVFDAVFRFIFFTIIGNILKLLFRPIVRASAHQFLSINKNMDILLEPFNKIAPDQSGLTNHVIYNEDLVYKLIDGLGNGIKEILNAPQEKIVKN